MAHRGAVPRRARDQRRPAAPFIIISTFVGYLAGGLVGALVITVGVFLPAFVFPTFFHRQLVAIAENDRLRPFLLGVAAGVIGLIAAVTVDIVDAGVVDVPPRSSPSAAFLALNRWHGKLTVLFVVAAAGGHFSRRRASSLSGVVVPRHSVVSLASAETVDDLDELVAAVAVVLRAALRVRARRPRPRRVTACRGPSPRGHAGTRASPRREGCAARAAPCSCSRRSRRRGRQRAAAARRSSLLRRRSPCGSTPLPDRADRWASTDLP